MCIDFKILNVKASIIFSPARRIFRHAGMDVNDNCCGGRFHFGRHVRE